VLLVAGQALLRAALRAVVSREVDMEVVGDAGDDQAVSALAVATRPDVAVLDLSAAGPGSLAIGEAIRRANPATRLLVLGHDPDPSAVRTALALGVTGYLVKDTEAAELLEAIRGVYRGRLVMHLGASGDMGSAWGAPAAEPNRRRGLARLTTRERHVLTMVAEGYTSRQIGQALSVRPKTVETHRARIATKLGVPMPSEQVRFAPDRGLLKGRAVGPTGETAPRVVTGNNDGTSS
jgi:DNA-binding NarL/FixJ family response regulator